MCPAIGGLWRCFRDPEGSFGGGIVWLLRDFLWIWRDSLRILPSFIDLFVDFGDIFKRSLPIQWIPSPLFGILPASWRIFWLLLALSVTLTHFKKKKLIWNSLSFAIDPWSNWTLSTSPDAFATLFESSERGMTPTFVCLRSLKKKRKKNSINFVILCVINVASAVVAHPQHPLPPPPTPGGGGGGDGGGGVLWCVFTSVHPSRTNDVRTSVPTWHSNPLIGRHVNDPPLPLRVRISSSNRMLLTSLMIPDRLFHCYWTLTTSCLLPS